MKNNGLKNEYLFAKSINGKKINELNFLLQELILYLFPDITSKDIIYCYKNNYYEKGDICIRVGKKIKYVSIKTGLRNSVHSEDINLFKKYLKKLGIDQNIINELLKYHYADGTIDGSGIERLNASEYKLQNKNSIELINNSFKDEKILKKMIWRFLLQGTQPVFHPIDILIYGTPSEFFFITPKEIDDYILSKKYIDSSSIHFSCLTYQPLSRVLDYDDSKEYMRHSIQIKWYNLEDCIIEILNMRVNNLKY